MEDSFLKSYLRQRREKRSSVEEQAPNTSLKKPGATVASGNVFGQVQVQKQKPDDSKPNQEVAPVVTPDQSAKEESKIESVQGQIRDSMLRSSIRDSSNAVIGAIRVLGVKIDGSIQKMTVKVIRELGKLNVSGSSFGLPDFGGNGPDSKGGKGGSKWGKIAKVGAGALATGAAVFGLAKLLGADDEDAAVAGGAGAVGGGVLTHMATKGVTAPTTVAAGAEGTAAATKAAASKGVLGTVSEWGGKALSKAAIPLTMLLGAADAYSTETDDALTREQKNVKHAGTGGGIAGGLAGAAVGATVGSVVPVVGTAIGGIVGGIAGGIGGSWLGEAGAEAFIESKVSDYAKQSYDKISSTSAEVFGVVKDVATGAAEYSASIFTEYKDKAAGYLDSAGEVFTSAATLSMGMVEKGSAHIANVGSNLIDSLPTSENIASYFKQVVQQGSDIQARATDTALAGISSIVVPISDAATVIGQSVSSFKTLYTNVVNNFDAVSTELSKTADTIKDGASSAASAVWAGVRAGAQRVAQGATEGAQNAPKGANMVDDAVNKVVGGVTGAVKAAPAASIEVAKGAVVATKKGSEVFGEIVASGAVSKGLGVGRFTEEEQKAIKEAQANGERFRGGQGLTQETKDKITATAEKYGIDPKHLMTMAQMESGGNPNAVSSTGASGLFQFTGGTGKQYGITNRFDQDQNIDAAARLYKDNAASLKKQGIEPTLNNIYLAHQQGAGGAGQIIRASEGKGQISETVARNMGLNVGGNESSAQGFRDVNAKHIAAAAKKAEAVTVADTTYSKKLSSTKPIEPKVAGTIDQNVSSKKEAIVAKSMTPGSVDKTTPIETKIVGTVTPSTAKSTTQSSNGGDAETKPTNEKPKLVAQQIYPQMFAKPDSTLKESKSLDTSKIIATQSEISKAPAALAETIAQSGPNMFTAKARSVEFERIKDPTPVAQVEISNFPEQEPQQTSMISGGHAGSVGRSAPFIDEIPLMVSDMGLVLLQTGHI